MAAVPLGPRPAIDFDAADEVPWRAASVMVDMGGEDHRPRNPPTELDQVLQIDGVGGVFVRPRFGEPPRLVVRLNFPLDNPVLDLGPLDPRVGSAREMQEDREAREGLKAEGANEQYMTELHRGIRNTSRGEL